MTTYAQAYTKLQAEVSRLLDVLETEVLSDKRRDNILRRITIFHNELVRIVNKKVARSTKCLGEVSRK